MRFGRFGTIALLGTALVLAGCSDGGEGRSTEAPEDRPPSRPPSRQTAPEAASEAASEAEREGLQALDEGRIDDAAAAFRRAIDEAPDDAEPRFLLGVCETQVGRFDAAVERFREALARDPGHLRARVTLARVLALAGRDEEAIEQFVAAGDAAPDALDLRVETAAAMIRAGRPDDAVAVLDEVVVREPMDVGARLAQAWALVAARRWSEAKSALERALTDFPQDPRFALMITRLVAAAPDAAVRDTGKAVRMAEAIARQLPSTESAEVLAMAYAQAGRFEDALATLDSAGETVRRSGNEALMQRFENLTAEFRAGRPCREPFGEGTPGLRPPPGPPFPTSPRPTP